MARLVLRLTLHQHQYYGRTIWITDLLLVGGLGCAIGSSACDTLVYKLGALQNFDDPSVYLGKVRPQWLCCRSFLGLFVVCGRLADKRVDAGLDSLRGKVLVRHWTLSTKAQPGLVIRDDGTEDESRIKALSGVHHGIPGGGLCGCDVCYRLLVWNTSVYKLVSPRPLV